MEFIRHSEAVKQRPRRFGFLLKRALSFAFLTSLVLSTGACTFEKQNSQVKSRAIAPPSADKNKLTPLAAQQTAMDTFRTLAPAEGLKYARLFDEPVENPDDRIKRIEDAVQSLKNDFDTTVPTLVRMVAIEKDIKNLVVQLQSIVEPGSAPAATPAPVAEVSEQAVAPPSPPPLPETEVAAAEPVKQEIKEEKPVEPLPPVSLTAPKPEPKPEPVAKVTEPPKSKGAVKDIQIADHKGKTRLVLEMSEEKKLTTKIEDEGLTLVIDLAGMDWLGKKKWEADAAELVSGYRVEGGKLYLELMYPSEVRLQELEAPSKEGKGHRLVIDLFSQDVHSTS